CCAPSATLEVSTLSLHDALPILAVPAAVIANAYSHPQGSSGVNRPIARDRPSGGRSIAARCPPATAFRSVIGRGARGSCTPLARDRKSTRLNSSHVKISYAVFCL